MSDTVSVNPFNKALDILDEKGWSKGQGVGDKGEICLGWALVEGERPLNKKQLKKADNIESKLLKGRGYEWERISTFNDAPETTEEDVRLFLKECAEEWDAS